MPKTEKALPLSLALQAHTRQFRFQLFIMTSVEST